MSVERNYYVIGGYDVTNFKTDKYKDWSWTEQGEKYTCNQSKGKIQFFNDPMSNSYLYFGYIFASGDEYEFDTACFSVLDIELCRDEVKDELAKLIEEGIISSEALTQAEFKIIAFEECT